MGAGRRCRLLPAFSTHSASPQVACCEMSVAEKLKISALLLCSLLGLLGLWGLAGPWGPGGSRNCWMRGGVWGKKRRLSLQLTPSPDFQSQVPGSPPSGGPREPPRSCHMLSHTCMRVRVCVCPSICGVQSCLGERYGLHQTGAHLSRTVPLLSRDSGGRRFR